jgi:hypothetical protein
MTCCHGEREAGRRYPLSPSSTLNGTGLLQVLELPSKLHDVHFVSMTRPPPLFALWAIACLLISERIALAQVTNDTIAHWKFDEGSGTGALDFSGNNHTGTISGAVYVTGRLSNALSFIGTSSYVFASDAQNGGVTGAGLDMGTRPR